MSETRTYVPCGNVLPGARDGIEPCPFERDHDGEHVYYAQTAEPHQKRKHNGVWVYAESGEVLMHMSFAGYVSPAEVGVMVTYLRWAGDSRAAREDTSATGERTA